MKVDIQRDRIETYDYRFTFYLKFILYLYAFVLMLFYIIFEYNSIFDVGNFLEYITEHFDRFDSSDLLLGVVLISFFVSRAGYSHRVIVDAAAGSVSVRTWWWGRLQEAEKRDLNDLRRVSAGLRSNWIAKLVHAPAPQLIFDDGPLMLNVDPLPGAGRVKAARAIAALAGVSYDANGRFVPLRPRET